jgi:hypothetical protein
MSAQVANSKRQSIALSHSDISEWKANFRDREPRLKEITPDYQRHSILLAELSK